MQIFTGNFEEAKTLNEANQWKKAMDIEMNSVVKNNTCTLLSKPVDKAILDVNKENQLIFIKLVFQGFQHKNVIDYTYSPVVENANLLEI